MISLIIALIITFILAAIAFIGIRVLILYHSAKAKHRNECLQPCIFIGERIYGLPFAIPRAIMPLFKCFEYKNFGITFHGVQIIVKDQDGNIVIGYRAGARSKAYLVDIGSAGMVPNIVKSRSDIESTAFAELHEELGLLPADGIMKYQTTYTPVHNIPCILHVFTFNMTCSKELKSLDETYNKICSYDINTIRNLHEQHNLHSKTRFTSACSKLIMDNINLF